MRSARGGSKPPALERRAHERRPGPLLGVLRSPESAASWPVTIINLGIGGVLVQTNTPLSPGAEYDLTFGLRHTRLATVVAVAHGFEDFGGYASGCAFHHSAPTADATMRQLLDLLTPNP